MLKTYCQNVKNKLILATLKGKTEQNLILLKTIKPYHAVDPLGHIDLFFHPSGFRSVPANKEETINLHMSRCGQLEKKCTLIHNGSIPGESSGARTNVETELQISAQRNTLCSLRHALN